MRIFILALIFPILAIAGDPMALSIVEEAKVKAIVSSHFNKISPEVNVSLGEILKGTENCQDVIAFEWIRVSISDAPIGDAKFRRAKFEIRNLAVDYKNLMDSKIEVVNNPIIAINIDIDKSLILGFLKKKGIKLPIVEPKINSLSLAGRYPVLIMSIPFRVFGYFYLNNNSIGFKVDRLTISGQIASDAKLQKVQNGLTKIINLGDFFSSVGIVRGKISSGSIKLFDGDKEIYSQYLEKTQIAE